MTQLQRSHIPLYVATDFNKLSGMSGLPQTIVSSSAPLNSANRGTGTTFDKPSRTAATWASNSCSL